VPVQVGLVVEADGRRDVGDRLAVEQPAAGGLDPAADEVAVRRQAELPAEAAHQVRRVGVQQRARLAQGDAVGQPAVQQVAAPAARRSRAAGRSGRR
jgi:hypothetical protein